MRGVQRNKRRVAAFVILICFDCLFAAAGCSKRVSPASTAAATQTLALPRALDASSDAAAESGSDPRYPSYVAALAWEVRVHQEPSLQSPMIGYLRAGAVVQAGAKAVTKEGCSGGWYAISPVGFVCVEANVATTDISTPIVEALSRRPDLDARFPYVYGLVRQHSPIYSRLPTRAEAAHAEYALAKHMAHWLRAKDGASFRADYWTHGKSEPPQDARDLWESRASREVPRWLEDDAQPPGNLSGLIVGRRLVVGHSLEHQGFAFIDTAVSQGRRYAVTTDLLVVPVDRLRPIEGSNYRGVRIPEEIDVPFALIRREGAYSYELRGEAMVRTGHVARRAAIKLTGKEQVVSERRYYETAGGKWLWDASASRVDRFKRLTKWAYDGEHWVEVSIANQTLVAYDGTKPVYATLVSTGEAGLDDPEKTKSTVLGEFRIFAKHVTTTMSSEAVGEEFQLKDIPYVQYFQEGYALHAAYWHDDFGIPRSHGCINLAPDDAKWLFSWTEPRVPAPWHGAHAQDHGSVVYVHK
jgi:L,D-transpeptidase catalytic domain